ncbi:MAG TPA: glutamate decarboxylase [Methanosarcina sp.]|nr:glutamate decarboxylase [Methanosarcina sp.]
MISKKRDLKKLKDSKKWYLKASNSVYFEGRLPKYEIPENKTPANLVYRLIHDELCLDGNPTLNLSSFVTTWMEPEADQIIMENLGKNLIDHFQYPQTQLIHDRIINMLGRLYNAPEDADFTGTACVGSSEAIILALLAHKWTWKNRREKENKAVDKPNIIFGSDAHICWNKFAKYFDVEPRIIPMEPDRFTISRDTVEELIDENTICVGAILGTTFTGEMDPIEEINELLVDIKEKKGWDIPIHVDAASGGFVIPFVNPGLKWDFRLSNVKSINVSSHKYGLVYPSVGWLIFRESSNIPEDLVFYVNYLGEETQTYSLNFSSSSSMLLAQYYNLLRFGMEGYKIIMNRILGNAQYLAKLLESSDIFDVLNSAKLFPVVTIKLKQPANYTVFELSHKLRERGWILPAFTLPKNAENLALMRVVVKENFSREMADMLFDDIMDACEILEGGRKEKLEPERSTDEGHFVT